MSSKVQVSEIVQHRNPEDVWIVVNGKVYDMTRFAPLHPGGSEVIYRYGGRDASKEYNQIHGPSLIQKSLTLDCHVGILDESSINDEWSANLSDGEPHTAAVEESSLGDVINLFDFEAIAQRNLSEKSWAVISGASNDSITREANLSLLRSIMLRPKVLRNVRTARTKTRLFGCDLDLPIYIAPMGGAKHGGPEGELAMARGAASSGIIHCISTPTSFLHEEILEVTPKHAFFQLYVDKERHKSQQAIQNATKTKKIKAIFVTVDLPVVSKREADERIKPEGPAGQKDRKGGGFARQASSFIDSTFSWEDLRWLRSITDLPIVVKGIQCASDAVIAMQMGCDGIVLSNHGGRAADTAPPGILTLLELHKNCPEVLGKMEVLVDGGFRRGSDIVKAICLGASAVGIGRPFMYALHYGAEGIEHAVEIIKDEIETAMRLCGMTDLMRDAHPDYVNTAAIDHLVPGMEHSYARKVVRSTPKL
ncbi:hypothetical protein H2204_002322 [Knufia peltigerae]|uniref:(S)-2-hydroxy-acid oxidase n=1 Tax=Knufia peltigerae TaxID=1002370 RepID=A0AA38YBA2_9EURO|nr:hypothetical protein H2204_002322 [Knufia peltigerae]